MKIALHFWPFNLLLGAAAVVVMATALWAVTQVIRRMIRLREGNERAADLIRLNAGVDEVERMLVHLRERQKWLHEELHGLLHLKPPTEDEQQEVR